MEPVHALYPSHHFLRDHHLYLASFCAAIAQAILEAEGLTLIGHCQEVTADWEDKLEDFETDEKKVEDECLIIFDTLSMDGNDAIQDENGQIPIEHAGANIEMVNTTLVESIPVPPVVDRAEGPIAGKVSIGPRIRIEEPRPDQIPQKDDVSSTDVLRLEDGCCCRRAYRSIKRQIRDIGCFGQTD